MASWLSSLGDDPGPEAHAARLWISHRRQRDAALEAAAEAGRAGWFDPPLHFLSDLRRLFDIGGRPIGVLTGRMLFAGVAAEHADRVRLPAPSPGRGDFRSHMLDGLIGELLAEGVTPDELAGALAGLEAESASDGFARERDRWVVETYRAYRAALDARGLFDVRETPALVARRIESGELPAALRGARGLHVYGLTSPARRLRLLRALAAQLEVDVSVYVIDEPELSEWEELTRDVHTVGEPRAAVEGVSSAPDALREAVDVARRVKRLLVEDGCRPSDIAVVARSGREDTLRMHRALAEAGVPSTARLRTTLAEIPALRALLDLFDAAAAGWDYRRLRIVGSSPYLGIGLDVRPLDFLAARRRIEGLEAWQHALGELAGSLAADPDRPRRLRAGGPTAASVTSAAETIGALAGRVSALAGERSVTGWIELTRSFTARNAFGLRRRICRVVGGRHDVVRLDQRGVRALDGLLAEWHETVDGDPRQPIAWWLDALRRLAEASDLVLSTPLEQGVQVLEAHEAALTPFRHVFVIHANEGEFPRTPRGVGVLSDDERRALAAAGLPVEDRRRAQRRERALWRAVTANPDTVVTWRSATASGIPLLPSLMVSADAAAPPRAAAPVRGALDAGDPASEADQRQRDVVRMARRRRGGDSDEIEVVDVPAVRLAVLGAFAEELRSGALDGAAGIEEALGLGPGPLLGRDRPVSERAHPWAGRIRDPVALAALADRFGPDHVWSANRLERYARRPFDFLLADVLRIERRGEAGEETTPLAAGRVSHALLEELHARLLAATPADFAAGASKLAEVCDAVFAAVEGDVDVWLGSPSVWRLKRRQLRRVLAEFVAWDFARLERLRARPIAAEVAFGYGGIDPVRLVGLDMSGRPADLWLAGRIDRIDRYGAPPGEIRVVDYKWKEVPSKRGFDDGAVLQPALYMKAWEALHGERPRGGQFLSISRPGRGTRSGLSADRVDDVLRRALSIPARVRAGLFEPAQAASCYPAAVSQPGHEVIRTAVAIGAGSRFDHPDG
jgi:RecB family exonuclease